jgi:hypothetical protein
VHPHREQALIALRLINQESWPDEDLAAAFGTQLAAAEATGYLVGFLLQLLALQRHEHIEETERYVRELLAGGDDGLAGVREPRRPLPPSGSAGTRQEPSS